MSRLGSKSAVITAAGQGIGRASALLLHGRALRFRRWISTNRPSNRWLRRLQGFGRMYWM